MQKSCLLIIIFILSHKFKISSSDCTNDKAILLKKSETKFHLKQKISDAATVKKLCNIRDHADFNLLSSSEISTCKLIDDICIH